MEQEEMTINRCRELAAQAWCESETEYAVMDCDLANAFARILYREVRKAEERGAAAMMELRSDDIREAKAVGIEEGWRVCRSREYIGEPIDDEAMRRYLARRES